MVFISIFRQWKKYPFSGKMPRTKMVEKMLTAFASLKYSKEKHNVQKPIFGRSEISRNLTCRGKGNNIFKLIQANK